VVLYCILYVPFSIWASFFAYPADITVTIEGSPDSTVLMEVYAIHDGDPTLVERWQVSLDQHGNGDTVVYVPDEFQGFDALEILATWRGLADDVVVKDLPAEITLRMHRVENV